MSDLNFELDDILSEFLDTEPAEQQPLPPEEDETEEPVYEAPAPEEERAAFGPAEDEEIPAEEPEEEFVFDASFFDEPGITLDEQAFEPEEPKEPVQYDELTPAEEQRPYEDEPAYENEPAYEDEPMAQGRPALQLAEVREKLRQVGESLRDGWDSLVDRIHAGRVNREERQPRRFEAPAWLPVVLTVALLALSCLCALWVLNHVHPGSGTAVKGTPRIDLAARVAPDAADETDPEGQTLAKKHWIIEESALVAPAPDPACFGTVSINEPEKVLDIIQQARESGLLGEEETVVFDPNVTFYYDEDIEYYLDDTILVICWKEVIDGNTCSFVEVKVADASQFRRKFADDTFASASQYYSTEMHKSTNAVVTLNADFYQNRDFGVVVYDRELYRFPTGTYTGSYKKYNCLETCFVDDKGDFLFTDLGQPFTKEELEQYIADNNILFSISFGPVLVRDGQVRQCDWYPVGEINRGYSRACIGQVDKLHYLYMSLNHSPEKEARWTVNEFALHFGEKPVINAYCLDGGQTGEIVFRDRAYNHVDVVNGQRERPVSDNIYFATAIGGTEVSK